MNNNQLNTEPEIQARYRLLDCSWVYFNADNLEDAILYYRKQLRRNRANRAQRLSFQYRLKGKRKWLS